MKKLLIPILFAVIISGCNKAGKSENTINDDPIPTASFRITNTVADETILEGSAINFENNSQYADSYEWDFGNGMMSAERTPVGIILRNCPRTQEIRLIVRTRRGRSATHIRTINVRCR